VWLTEIMTAGGIVAILPLPLEAVLALLPLVGVALNGTSSVLYGSVPELVSPESRTRAFGVFYTGTVGAGALAPVLYGALADRVGMSSALVAVAAMVLVNVPLVARLAPRLRSARGPGRGGNSA
jgi:predicted MFS family arabinose efflux permease